MKRLKDTEVAPELLRHVLKICESKNYDFRYFSKGMGGTQITFVCPTHGVCTNKAWKFTEACLCRKCVTDERRRTWENRRKKETEEGKTVGRHQMLQRTLSKISAGRLLQEPDSAYDPVAWECNCGNRDVKPISPYRLARLKYGCRTCANEATNAGKREQPVAAPKILKSLCKRFPELKISYLTSRFRASATQIVVRYVCPSCGSEDRIYLKNLKEAPRSCKRCEPKAVVNKNSFRVKKVRDKLSGKEFLVQGYELDALKILRARGCNLAQLTASQDIIPIPYLFGNKLRKYKPDLKYENTVIEVKSLMTAGICPQSIPAFEQLKAKAQAVKKAGSHFYLMILHKKEGELKQLRLPKCWSRLTLDQLRKRLGLSHERVTSREALSLDVFP